MKLTTILLSFQLILLFSYNYQSDKKTSSKDKKSDAIVIVYEPELLSDSLPQIVEEQSGMICHNNLIWVNNDSGGAPELYAYDFSGHLKQTIHVNNITNLDWEALADDEKYFYIGDFGNNFGTRKNLKLYRIAKPKSLRDSLLNENADEICFEWADQKEFLPLKHKHNYDCEAFFSYGDSLYFFTKNWGNLKTRMYVMPKKNEYYRLYPKGTFEADLLVTGADISPDGKIVALVGYKNYRTYMILFYDFKGVDFFSGKNIRLDLKALGGAQTEGVVFTGNGELYINTEATNQPQSIYKVDWKQWIKI